ncbi:MAG: hypothetical protein PHQ05_04805 [Sterolibacterium sp.]|nr:hypothetical protein [Sterolibacterium sp.]
MKTIAALFAFAAVSLAAIANPPATTALPASHPVSGAADMAKTETPVTKKGKVLSSIDTKGFTYIEVQDGNKKFWVVSPTITVKAGNTIAYADAPVQARYHSPSLKRDFTNVILSTRVTIEK